MGAAQILSLMGVGSMSPQQSTTPEENSWRAVVSESMASRRAMIRSASWRLTRLRALTTGHHVGAALYAEQMDRLGPAMREIGRSGWSNRPGTAYDWY